MSVLIAPLPTFGPRREPRTVTALRQQLARGASSSVLYRIAGSETEYRRLAAEYKLRPAPAPIAAPPRAVSVVAPAARQSAWERRARLMRYILGTAEAGLVFPETPALARELGLVPLDVEHDLLGLVRDGRVRVSSCWCIDRAVRRIELVGRNLFTALPPLERTGGMA